MEEIELSDESKSSSFGEYIKETKNYDWVRCFMPRIEDFLDEESTTPEIVETFLSIFGVEIEWEVIW